MNLSNLIHPNQNNQTADVIRRWMRRNYRRHLAATGLDIESLAEQAAYELECNREMADTLAEELAEEIR